MELEMRIVKKVAAAAMAMAVVFGAAFLKPVAANAAQAGPETASVMEEENSFLSHQDEAYQNEFLRRVNSERAKAGLKPVQLGDSSHNSAAQERAKELASSYSYVRPNGQPFVPMASAILPSSQRMASKMCRLARTTWRAFPPPMQRWISG